MLLASAIAKTSLKEEIEDPADLPDISKILALKLGDCSQNLNCQVEKSLARNKGIFR